MTIIAKGIGTKPIRRTTASLWSVKAYRHRVQISGIEIKSGENSTYVCVELGCSEVVSQAVGVVLIDAHGYLVELGDEGVLGPVDDHFGGDDQRAVRQTGHEIICNNN